MKKIMFLFMAFFAVCKMYAKDDRLWMLPVSAEAGEVVTLPVFMDSKQPYTAMMMDMVLPEGIDFVQEKKDGGAQDYAVSYASQRMFNSHELNCRLQNDGALRIVGYSMANDTVGTGLLLLVKLQISEQIEPGDYKVIFKNVSFTSADGSDHAFADAEVAIKVKNHYSLTLVAQPAKGGVVMGANNYVEGSIVSIAAAPNDGYVFTEWTDANGQTLSTESGFDYTIDCTSVLTAHFAQFMEVHDTAYVEVHDTTYVNVDVHDTTYIDKHDTIYLDKIIEISDTVYLSDLQRVESPCITISSEGIVTMSCPQANAIIYYTVDGTEPDENSNRYTQPFSATDGSLIRAVSIMKSEVASIQTTEISTARHSPEASLSYFNLHGSKSSAGQKGILLKSSTMPDGRRITQKVINR